MKSKSYADFVKIIENKSFSNFYYISAQDQISFKVFFPRKVQYYARNLEFNDTTTVTIFEKDRISDIFVYWKRISIVEIELYNFKKSN